MTSLYPFEYREGSLCLEDVPLSRIVETHGSPCFVYSRATIEANWQAYHQAIGDYPHQICYAVKANSNLGVLNVLARLGSGFDIVSFGELQRVIAAGGSAADTVFSGVGKQAWEIDAALRAGLRQFNIESVGELALINELAAACGVVADISVRINPDVDAQTHPYISTGMRDNKFGLEPEFALTVYQQAAAMDAIKVHGVACHIGSQITELAPFADAIEKILDFIDLAAAQDIDIQHIDFGGGIGVAYNDETVVSRDDYWQAIASAMSRRQRRLPITFEPGRSIVANAGALITEVLNIKQTASKRFCVVDAAMNDLIRPALYQAKQRTIALQSKDQAQHTYDVVGPVCESADFLAKDVELAVGVGDHLAVLDSGAYGFVMSSNYNSRPRCCEIMVDGSEMHVVRQRETIEALYRDEQILP